MQETITNLQSQLSTEQDRYISQFTQMERLINQMKFTVQLPVTVRWLIGGKKACTEKFKQYKESTIYSMSNLELLHFIV